MQFGCPAVKLITQTLLLLPDIVAPSFGCTDHVNVSS